MSDQVAHLVLISDFYAGESATVLGSFSQKILHDVAFVEDL
jgi:hypothetical protein